MTTLYQKLLDAGLPVVSATEEGQVVMNAMTPEQEQQYLDVVEDHFDHVKHLKNEKVKNLRETAVEIADMTSIFKNATPEDLDNFIDSHFPSLSNQEKEFLKDIAKGTMALFRARFPEIV